MQMQTNKGDLVDIHISDRNNPVLRVTVLGRKGQRIAVASIVIDSDDALVITGMLKHSFPEIADKV